jgi:hypothetical protein
MPHFLKQFVGAEGPLNVKDDCSKLLSFRNCLRFDVFLLFSLLLARVTLISSRISSPLFRKDSTQKKLIDKFPLSDTVVEVDV